MAGPGSTDDKLPFAGSPAPLTFRSQRETPYPSQPRGRKLHRTDQWSGLCFWSQRRRMTLIGRQGS